LCIPGYDALRCILVSWIPRQSDGLARTASARPPGRPDIVLPRWKATILINGCFWHAHQDCALFRLPATRPDFWLDKLMGNRVRDAANVYALAAQGWRTAVVWECALRLDMVAVGTLLEDWIRSDQPGCELLRCGAAIERRLTAIA
jgi:DNA mismatch endonuclease Vsr